MPVKLLAGARPLSRSQALRDVLAGLNLGSINIPQVLGYARIAGMPLVTRLYTLLLPLVAFALFGSSRQLVVAADSATAAILSGSLAANAVPGSAHYVALVGMLALLTGVLLLIARIFRLGFLADFLSRTVLVGFLTGVGIQVGIAMLGDMAGVATSSRYSLMRLWQVLADLQHPHVATLALSAAVAGAELAGNRWAPRWPLSLIAVVAAIWASGALDFSGRGIAVMGPLAGGLPSLGFPHVALSEVLMLIPVAGSCFVMIIAQSSATSRAFALLHRENVDGDRDLIGLGAANIAAGLSGTFVVNGSPSQTAMADHVGARSQIAQLTLAVVVFAVLVFLAAPLQHLPRCVLAAIVFTIGLRMIDVKRLRAIRRESPGEFLLAIITTAAVVAVGTEQGILLAIALSLFRHVHHSYRPHTTMFVAHAKDRWVLVPAVAGKETEPGLIVYRFGADLFYANQNRFCDEVRTLVECAPSLVRCFIVDAGAITDLDYSAAQSMLVLIEDMVRREVCLIFGRVSPYLKADMDRHGVTAALGAGQVFDTLHEAVASVRSHGVTIDLGGAPGPSGA
jgi:MFS superfamily sulfate permease-like transporter